MTRQLKLHNWREPQATNHLHAFPEPRLHMEVFPCDGKGKLVFGKQSLLYNFTIFKLVWSFWRWLSFSWGYWVGEDKDRDAVSWKPCVLLMVQEEEFSHPSSRKVSTELLWVPLVLVAAQAAAKAGQASECAATTCDPWKSESKRKEEKSPQSPYTHALRISQNPETSSTPFIWRIWQPLLTCKAGPSNLANL